MKIRIDSDVYMISERVKDIDKDYLIVFDTEQNQYELHNLNQPGSTYCLRIPYNQLDYRVLELTNQTMSKNIDTILAKIEDDNKIMAGKEKSDVFNNLIDAVFDK